MAEVPKPSLDGMTPAQIAWAEDMEKTVGARTVSVTRNNKFPRWSPERWMAFVSMAILITTSSVAGIWFAGGEWRGVKQDVETLKSDIAVMKADVRILANKVIYPPLLDEADEPIRRPRLRQPSPVPVFPRDEQLEAGQ